MKKLAIPLLALFVACSGDKPGNTKNNYNTSPVVKDSAASVVVQKISNPEAFIRQQVEHINTTSLQTKHIEFMCDEKTLVDYYYEDGKLVKISIDFGWVGDVHAMEDYYFNKDILMFFYESTEGGPACESCIKTNEYRSYIKDDKVFKYLKNKTLGSCRKCEFGASSKPYKLLKAKTTTDVKAVLCR